MDLIQWRDEGSTTVVRFTRDRISDVSLIATARRELLELVDTIGKNNIIIDLEDVTSIVSDVLGSFVLLFKKTKAKGGKLVLCNVGAHVQEILKITRLDKLFSIAADLPAALAQFQAVS